MRANVCDVHPKATGGSEGSERTCLVQQMLLFQSIKNFNGKAVSELL
jgi:hypothetical protein